VDIGKGSVEENVIKLRYYAEPDNMRIMCANVRRRFSEVVDFDCEEQDIRAFLGRLV
jgi:hypothetical protein